MLSILKNLKEETLQEDSKSETTHPYTAIAIDTESNEFKIINGNFADKKEFYERLANRGLVCRKIIEKPIYEWIMKNADTNLDAYAMFSTAFSKWRGNNLLSDDYVQLLNDVPALNRERRKGDPNTKGKAKKGWDESVLTEDRVYSSPDVDTEHSTTHKIAIYPIGIDGERDPKFANNPIMTQITLPQTDDPKKKYDDPEFYRFMFKLMKIDAIGGRQASGKPILHPAFEIVFDDNYSEPVRMTSQNLLANYTTKNKNALYRWGHTTNTQHGLQKQEFTLKDEFKKAKEEGDRKKAAEILQQLKDVQDRKADEIRTNQLIQQMTGEEKQKFKNLRALVYNLQQDEKLKNNADATKHIQRFVDEMNKLKTKAMERIQGEQPTYFVNTANTLYDMQKNGNNSVAHGNPNFGGDPFSAFANNIDKLRKSNEIIDGAEKIKNSFAIKVMNKEDQKRYYELAEELKNRDPKKDREFNEKQKMYQEVKNNLLAKAKQQDNELTKKFTDLKNKTEKDIKDLLDSSEKAAQTKIKAEIAALPKDASRPTAREQILLNNMSDKRKAQYNKLKDELTQYNDALSTTSKAVQDDFYSDSKNYGKSAVNVINDALVKTMPEKDKELYVKTSNLIKKIDNYLARPKYLKNEMDKLVAKSRQENTRIIEAMFNDYGKGKEKKNFKFKAKQDLSSEEMKRLLKGYGANKLKRMGYDPTLDLSPYRKTESFVNDGASLMYATQPKISRSGTPLSIGGSFVETTTHSELNPDLFENDKLKLEIKEALLNIAETFKEILELPFEPVDIYFTGSCANYNYNEQSDIDLHLVYDFENAGVNAEILSKYLQSAKKVFNDKYDITIKNIPVEVGAENLNEPLVSTGIYSVMNDNWLRKPENADTEIAEPDMPYYTKLTDEIESAIQSQDSSIIGALWKKLGKLRKESLAKEGEFGPGNALFKKLRNLNYLTRLKDAYYDNKSQELSLESLEEID